MVNARVPMALLIDLTDGLGRPNDYRSGSSYIYVARTFLRGVPLMLSLRSWIVCLGPVFAFVLWMTTGSVSGQGEKHEDGKKFEVEKTAPLVVALPVCGPEEEKTPFNIANYGKVRGFNPISDMKAKGVVLLTRKLDEGFFRFAAAVEGLVASQAKSCQCIVIVIDEKGAQVGGYTAQEFETRRAEVGKLAKTHKLNHLSFYIASSPPNAIGSSPELRQNNLVLAVVGVDSDHKHRRPITRLVLPLDAEKMNDNAIERAIAAIKSEVTGK